MPRNKSAARNPSAVASSVFTEWLDELLAIQKFEDYAFNGLQIAGPKTIKKIGLSVDASLASIAAAARQGIDFLIVHHGIFWGKIGPLRGRLYQLAAPLIRGGIGLYAAHLPLDAHPKLGNNYRLCQRLGLRRLKAFGPIKSGQLIGMTGTLPAPAMPRALQTRLEKLLGAKVEITPLTNRPLTRLAVVSGGGGGFLAEAAATGADAFLTGELVHHERLLAKELDFPCFLAGHYQTETFGLQALGRAITQRWQVEVLWVGE
jgi:dinuclear metal center YbgI/SA1388 family protein